MSSREGTCQCELASGIQSGLVIHPAEPLLKHPKKVTSSLFLLHKAQCELYCLHLECSDLLTNSDFDLCDRITYLQAQRTSELRAINLERKFSFLVF